jgi:hypothetical protein
MEPAEYCREIETYLCRKNEGHLIRIVGPAFEQVCGWAVQGVPLKVAFRGIDQYCDRYYAKGPRRRPVRIEFCEADILDLFDAWRRAVGVAASGLAAAVQEAPSRRPALAAHIERVVARLATVRGRATCTPLFMERIDAVVRELEHLSSDAHTARGGARTRIIQRLQILDEELIAMAAQETSADDLAVLRTEADAELLPFAQRMPVQAFERGRAAAFNRLLRDFAGLPVVTFE